MLGLLILQGGEQKLYSPMDNLEWYINKRYFLAFVFSYTLAGNKQSHVVNTGHYEAESVSKGISSWCKCETQSQRTPPSSGGFPSSICFYTAHFLIF